MFGITRKRTLGFVFPALVVIAIAGFVGHGFLNRGAYAVAFGREQDGPAAYTDGRPNLVGAMFNSAWCSSCAVLEPRLQKIVPTFSGRAVEFAKFDFSMGQPESLADKARALGVERVYRANQGATGFMLLVDRRTERVISMITLTKSDQVIHKKIDDAIRSAALSPA
jgi:hypothetical protein